MASRVIVHVGVPKTGTSYVQDLLFNNRDALAEQGITYPCERHDAQFLAALVRMQLTWGGLERDAVGAWQRLVDAVAATPGTAIISHEILGFASRAHVAAALEDLAGGEVWGRAAPRSRSWSRHATWSARSRPSGRRTSSTGAR